MEDIEMLALVLMDPLDLDVKKRSWVYLNAGSFLDKSRNP